MLDERAGTDGHRCRRLSRDFQQRFYRTYVTDTTRKIIGWNTNDESGKKKNLPYIFLSPDRLSETRRVPIVLRVSLMLNRYSLFRIRKSHVCEDFRVRIITRVVVLTIMTTTVFVVLFHVLHFSFFFFFTDFLPYRGCYFTRCAY